MKPLPESYIVRFDDRCDQFRDIDYLEGLNEFKKTFKTTFVPLDSWCGIKKGNYVGHCSGKDAHHIFEIFHDMDKNSVEQIFSRDWYKRHTMKPVGYKIKKLWPGITPEAKVGMLIRRVNNIYTSFEVPKFQASIKQVEEWPEFFEPVYELPEESIALSIGIPQRAITITNKKKIIHNAYIFQIDQIKQIRELLLHTTLLSSNLPALSITTSSLWIGCVEQGTSINLKDVETIISTYYKLNPDETK